MLTSIETFAHIVYESIDLIEGQLSPLSHTGGGYPFPEAVARKVNCKTDHLPGSAG
jgi:hypothetical protein